jgi:hypothetical protein
MLQQSNARIQQLDETCQCTQYEQRRFRLPVDRNQGDHGEGNGTGRGVHRKYQ